MAPNSAFKGSRRTRKLNVDNPESIGKRVEIPALRSPLGSIKLQGFLRRPTSSKLRRTFFRKRLDAFLDLGAAHAVAVAAVGGPFIQGAPRAFVDRALHSGHRDRRVARQRCRQSS